MEDEVKRIANSVEALIWALGCVWGIRVERSINEARPELNCVLFLVGLYLTVHYLLTHLTWYGLGGDRQVVLSVPREFIKLGLFFVVTAVVAFVTPGRRARRMFAALVFPLLGLWGLLSVAAGFQVSNALMSPLGRASADVALRGLCGLVFGAIVASLLSLPCVLLYRDRAIPIAVLALLPAIARSNSLAGPADAIPNSYLSFFELLWPFICSLFLIAIFCSVCSRWVSRPSDGHF